MNPADNLAVVAGVPRRLTIGRRDYDVRKLSPRGAGKMQALIMQKVPDPRVRARSLMEGLPDAVQTHIWDRACVEALAWPPSIESPAGQAVLLSPEGMGLVLELALGLPQAEAADLADAIDGDTFGRLLELIQPGEPGDPKAG